MLTKLAIWYLRKRKRTVLMNIRMYGNKVQQISYNGFFYDNDLMNIEMYDTEGNPLHVPQGKFHIQTPSKEENS